MSVYKIFCDESCHLEHDHADIMVLGALFCSAEKAIELSKAIKQLKEKHKYIPELKWSRLHKHQWQLYKELIDLFVKDNDINFKATVVSNKQALDHQFFNDSSHNDFYYKMFYYTLRDFLKVGNEYRIYLDFMDTHGSYKSKKLSEILQNATHWQLKTEFTIIRSHESVIMQLCDLFIGALAYRNRTDIPKHSPIKNQFIEYLEKSVDKSLFYGTPPWEKQFNIFKFQPRGRIVDVE